MVSHHKENPGRSALQGLHLWQDQDPNQASTAAPHTCPYQNPTVLVKKGDDEEGANQHHGLKRHFYRQCQGKPRAQLPAGII